VAVFDQRRATAFICCIGETRNQHASGQGVSTMWADGAARGLGEIVDCLRQLWFCRIRVDVENKHPASFETRAPELTPVISEAGVVRLITSINGSTVDDFAIARRVRLYVDGDEFVRAIAETFDTKCPDIDKLLLSVDASEVR